MGYSNQFLNAESYAEISVISDQEVKSSAATFEHGGRHFLSWRVLVTTILSISALAVIIIATMPIADPATVFRMRRNSLMAPLNVLVVGDWGRQGQFNQTRVADLMGRVGMEVDVNFIISTGDNFYDSGLSELNDALFEESFTEIYQAPSLQKPWYTVLGNHDYRGDPSVQVDDSLKLRDPRWHCDYHFNIAVDLSYLSQGKHQSQVEFFFIDTNLFDESYWVKENLDYNWTRPPPREDVMTNQLKVLETSLKASTAAWKVVVGHHPVFSYGVHGDTAELIDKVLPILEANEVDMYVNGHDHDLQHIKRPDSDIHFLTSGGGSKAWRGDAAPADADDSKLFYDGQGFVSLSITPTVLQVNFYDIEGTIIHQMELFKRQSLNAHAQ